MLRALVDDNVLLLLPPLEDPDEKGDDVLACEPLAQTHGGVVFADRTSSVKRDGVHVAQDG
eukprot:3907000-Lingulodinium_polyedra.AAC.1